MEEIWKDIKGYEGYYQVSNLGRVKRLDKIIKQRGRYGQLLDCFHKGRIKSTHIDKYGYTRVDLYKNSKCIVKQVHRLVAIAFIPNIENKPEVNHIDGNKQNNNINNLEWCTRTENERHAYKTGLKKSRYGKDNKNSKPVIQYDLNMNIIAEYVGAREAGRKTGYNQSNITKCCNGKVKTAGGYIWRYKE